MISRRILSAAAVAAILLTSALAHSCRVVPDNDKLDAQWQLLTITDDAGNETTPDPRTYFNFYRSVAQISQYGGNRITANLALGDSLSLQFPYADAAQLRRFYLPVPAEIAAETKGLTVKFYVNQLSEDKLVMTAANYDVYTFRRY